MDDKRLNEIIRELVDKHFAAFTEEARVDFMIEAQPHIDAQAERIKALEAEIGHLHRRQHPSDAPSEVRVRTATAIAREIIALAEAFCKQSVLDICRANGAEIQEAPE